MYTYNISYMRDPQRQESGLQGSFRSTTGLERKILKRNNDRTTYYYNMTGVPGNRYSVCGCAHVEDNQVTTSHLYVQDKTRNATGHAAAHGAGQDRAGKMDGLFL